MQQRKCIKCGYIQKFDLQFCQKCGEELIDEETFQLITNRQSISNRPLAESLGYIKSSELKEVPRVFNQNPNIYTIEWAIPHEVRANVLRIVNTYFFTAKIRVQKKHWWSKSNIIFQTSSLDIIEVIEKGFDFLVEHGYIINPDSLEWNERI